MSAVRATTSSRVLSRASRVVLSVVTVVLVTVNIAGSEYYAQPMAERVRSTLHAWLRPSGVVGQSAGILALLIFAFLWLYPVRKKFRSLAWAGPLAKWLDVHITAALMLPLLLTIHAAWRFRGIPGLSFDAMMIVCASGIVGRYLYVRIPRSASGVALTLERRSRLMGVIGPAASRARRTSTRWRRPCATSGLHPPERALGRRDSSHLPPPAGCTPCRSKRHHWRRCVSR